MSQSEIHKLAILVTKVLRNEELYSGETYKSLNEADIEGLFDSSDADDEIRNLGHKLLGLDYADKYVSSSIHDPDMSKSVEHVMSFDEFLNGCTLHGGNWSAMIMSGIKEFFPEYYESMEDKDYEFTELIEIIRNLGVYWDGSDSEVK